MIGVSMQILLTPPVAFLVYLFVAGMLVLFGKALAGRSKSPSALKTSTYSSGETPPTRLAAPGYRPFFVVALFFAVLHLGVLVMSTGSVSPVMIIYLASLIIALLALTLG
jgi:NADH:ubiquinone oxidoreductase subunit 3 (subunit A)